MITVTHRGAPSPHSDYQHELGIEEGFVTASVVDPFGNILGIMYNPHYLDVLDSTSKV